MDASFEARFFSRATLPSDPRRLDLPRMSASSATALSALHVSKRFGDVVALDDVTLDVPRGECVALVGESGSGKTTLLRAFNRLTEIDNGVVRVDGIDASTIDAVDLRRRTGYVPQDGGLIPHWSVQRNVELVLRLNDTTDRERRAREALDLVGLDPSVFAARWPRELSGGQRQRVAIARALASQPPVLLLDEPFGALDAITRADLQDAFANIRRRLSVTSVLVTHDLHEAARLATTIAVMRRGKVEQVATPSMLVQEPGTDYVRELLRRARVSDVELAT
jgi:osmoprotectant transport system ATP-binding protein